LLDDNNDCDEHAEQNDNGDGDVASADVDGLALGRD
jgi:hypothetical protein